VTATRFRLETLADLEAADPPIDVVDGFLGVDALAALYGATGVGKSFSAVWLAVCISEGIPFFGHRVKAGPVIIVVMEGGRRYRYRLRAACDALDIQFPGQLYVTRQPLYPHMAESVLEYIEAIRVQRDGAPVSLTILDTLARASAGSNENSNADRELTIDGLRAIQRETGGAVLVIAHPGWNETRLRGGYTLLAAMDSIFRLFQDESAGGLILEVEKQRDGESGQRYSACLTPAGDSMVFGPRDAMDPHAGPKQLSPAARKALETLSATALSDGISAAVWERAAGLPASTFFRVKKDLILADLVQVIAKGRHVVSLNGRPLLP